MIGRGRPLRFVALVAGGWIALRVGLLWQVPDAPPQLASGEARAPRIAKPPTPIPVTATQLSQAFPAPVEVAMRPAPVSIAAIPALPVSLSPPPAPPTAITVATVTPATVAPLGTAPIPPPLPAATPVGRWSATGWLLVRQGAGLAVAGSAPQLGGSQVGVRVDRALGGGLAITARVSAALRGGEREIAPGISWQPRDLPVRVMVEQRIAVDGGRGGTAIGIAGGLWDQPLPAGLRLEGYGQAGAVARAGIEGYADGMVRVARPILVGIDIGVGGWGGAQRDASRLDIGPSIAVRLPLADGGARLTLDWRQRIAGSATPGSGPALTLGTDF